MVIAPKVFITPDRPVIRFKQPREKTDLDKEIQRVLRAQGWGLGTYFNVQFVSHDETELISQAKYVVSKDCEDFQTNEDNLYNPSSKTVHLREAILVDVGESDSSEALPAIISGLDSLEGKVVAILEDGTARNEQVEELSNRIAALEERKKPGPKPKPKLGDS
jgi:hypothetical protein